MKTGTDYEVVEIIEDRAEVVLEWNTGQVISHRIPIEAELEQWTEQQTRAYLLSQAPQVPEIPEFLKDMFVAKMNIRFHRTPGGGQP